VDELVDPSNLGQQLVDSWIALATNEVEVLPCTTEAGTRNLVLLQVTTRSPMGALGYGTGGVLVDHGWVRILGAGNQRMGRSIVSWNGRDIGKERLPGALLVADDAIGGFFAINGGRFSSQAGSVYYFAPDTLAWEDLDTSYSDWLVWLLTGNLETFYAQSRWPHWCEDTKTLHGDRGLCIYPFPSAEGPPFGERTRGEVPIDELWRLYAE
jgi:hypothetical protein